MTTLMDLIIEGLPITVVEMDPICSQRRVTAQVGYQRGCRCQRCYAGTVASRGIGKPRRTPLPRSTINDLINHLKEQSL